ncbi:hypothetical protein ACFL27_23725 [candidate division CSSED10-310 bacterium]|uniref:N-formylglutamate amidohydrolase n=1 Tax=candidate division CSSED10-310 bacterium TaxID=2855610 RepID=A0ABV6Z456_UNCC1
MKKLVWFSILVLSICLMACVTGKKTVKTKYRGLTESGHHTLEKLLSLQDKPQEFSLMVHNIAGTGNYESILILTHALCELPKPQAAPFRRTSPGNPLILVEMGLDQLVGANEHDRLSAEYFRAIYPDFESKMDDPQQKRVIDKAWNDLLEWTLQQRDILTWDGHHFH